MTIKKPTVAAEAPSAAPQPMPGGATIADRFKLDMPDPNAKPAKGGVSNVIALVAALVALAVTGILTFVIYQHWEFLKGA